ncbi:uncharacterized protein L203_102731 [Cryptococcus depauperatus CBS 7841]|uniref:Uncharacterized protein n=1 Tax=Cryptococcus depauperatus CBS 7841 TaxID=1295531 RepID=A0A1E3HUY1_9TREE|nr:hypothetical protein L203_05952 [Cryptococcus depauperatus CBS 7841]
MLPIEEILKTALKEHEFDTDEQVNVDEHIQRVKNQMSNPSSIEPFSQSSSPLSVVSFQCLLQDTGYPMEVYLPGEFQPGRNIDWSKLKERWVGWGVEIPGEQLWAKKEDDLFQGIQELSIASKSLPCSVYSKYPLPDRKGEYLGALLKVYDEVTFKPASIHKFVGLVSTCPMPSYDPEEADIVPVIHVLSMSETEPTHEILANDENLREELLDYLAGAFDPPDKTAAEYLLLLLISSPNSRPVSLPVLGTLSIKFRCEGEKSLSQFHSIVSAVTPRVVLLPLTISLLHSHRFLPCMTDTHGLEAGLLQLGDGTVLVVKEDGMGNGGALNERALKNLKALVDCLKDQNVTYEYPYMDGLKMDCAIRIAVLGQGKSLFPLDVDIPIIADGSPSNNAPSLDGLRSYLSRYSSPMHASRFSIPEKTSQFIQEHFVQERKSSSIDAEATLRRRMIIARIMALSYPHATLTEDVWMRTVMLDERIMARHAAL